MLIDDKLLNKLENLSAIKIDDNKKDEIKSQISEILNFVENLNSLDLPENIPHKILNTTLRDDIVEKSNVSESILKNAPNSEDNFFIVPKIVE
ncbi:Asp-tRNA(Asn)/Glu-tRNA(Gln) amidotransferase subunit GatC [Helicobacter sp. MIT 14-3879]|uniref:Asp-tRNA(Asn)/Glu-tRNA(Gln) amidotransferase subunit GatC n=1 Tax=Helicobacter sp. MIT 14-3879 TaxID=2040649 RepID=UPI000E1E9A58|nr:Asp-tRNA(Asn)/Glu-tRNA(Gln) amidotransferase subunit GatC [Helicobacter sp. MIT 14-3879]RDU64709.1 Asp-tRNA(Asn)/Glu-tRNA(Gln) amidotransferase subunit GatC [Helicobacter sp. MIT 14-3879]